jgi:hypothetical protein
LTARSSRARTLRRSVISAKSPSPSASNSSEVESPRAQSPTSAVVGKLPHRRVVRLASVRARYGPANLQGARVL